MISLRIKELCKLRGIAMQDLADRIGISRVSLSGIATGKQKPAFDTLEKLAIALEVSPAELFAPQPTNTITCPHCGKPIKFEKGE